MRLGQGCVYVSGGDKKTLTPANNFVVNNHLHDYAVLQNQYSPAVQMGFKGNVAVGNLVAHNLIHHAPRDAVVYGGEDNVFEYNEIHSCAYDTADTGAFYSWNDWTIRGTVIRYNFIHDTVGRGQPGRRGDRRDGVREHLRGAAHRRLDRQRGRLSDPQQHLRQGRGAGLRHGRPGRRPWLRAQRRHDQGRARRSTRNRLPGARTSRRWSAFCRTTPNCRGTPSLPAI